MKKEFIIWGIAPGNTSEEVLISETFGIQKRSEAEKLAFELEEKHNCKNVRVQVIDFSTPLNFTNILN